MTDWTKVLRTVAPKGKSSIIAGLAAAMPLAIEKAALGTMLRQAHFIAQLAHESDGFRTTVEYSSGAAYEGRGDLGNTHRGDGKRYKGRGLIQLTGRANYAEFGEALGVDLIGKPELAAQFPYAALTAALYWRKRAINADADADNLRGVTRKINGGYNGLAARGAYLKAAKRALAAPAPVLAAEETVSARDLRKAGSRTIAGADEVKNSLGGALATAGGAAAVASQVSDVATQVSSAADAVQSTGGALAWAQGHWQLIAIAVLGLLCAYFAWRVWHGANRVERARVDDANSAIHLGG